GLGGAADAAHGRTAPAVVAAPAGPSTARGACARAAGGAKLVTGGTGRSGAKFSRGGGEEVAHSRV
uniref:hypothetical protein n=1 Tax=Streptomyces hygroscopicus TaxID=1912 RepID=UPI000AAE835A